MSDPSDKLRLDKWLWFARFFKTRSLSAARVAAGDVRVNGERVTKRATTISAGDVLTFAIGDRVRIIEVVAIGTRRGPAPEAQTLYSDMSPEAAPRETPVSENPRFEGKGRPTKRDRRQGDLSRARHLE
ncbi:RNA-binding S4 domain-containing protein [uncultured Tateyamaria sp.]|uniref:RNA-binding S4 domain-containing protein n=1 Tax=uncultured Tateyamaria sp. TaxID=455651 RepID=UPI0026188D92|nr:RNA-binding S4 domain-containing protein [uncultured Tateyamaria sp.]